MHRFYSSYCFLKDICSNQKDFFLLYQIKFYGDGIESDYDESVSLCPFSDLPDTWKQNA